jgi:cell division protein FtsI (penicillin-binding protein 3)
MATAMVTKLKRHRKRQSVFISGDIHDVSFTRLKLLFFGLFAVFILLSLRIVDLAVFTSVEEVRQYIARKNQAPHVVKRANIYDSQGNILATNLITASLYANPKEILDAKAAAREISQLMPELPFTELYNKLNSGKKFVWLKRHLPPAEQQRVYELGLPGLYMAKDEKRSQPHAAAFSHVVGLVDVDGNGLSGLEKQFDEQLRQQPEGVHLSLDSRIQWIVREELMKAVQLHNAKGGVAVVADVTNGQLVSMVSLPDYDPAHLHRVNDENIFNRVTSGVYEMGSIFKPISIAIALESERLSMGDVFNVSKPLKVSGHYINDYRGGKGGYLSVPEVLMYSSNKATAQIASGVGYKMQREYLQRLGAFERVGVELPERARSIYPQDSAWSDVRLATISYGHGIAITPLHMVKAMIPVFNGGTLYEPSLIKSSLQPQGQRVFNPKTSDMLRRMLRLVVAKGYSRKADVAEYAVIGKTGTAEKIENGRYLKNANVSSFIGAFPGDKPRYLLLVTLDESQKNEINFGFTTGGMVAAPVAKDIISRIAPVLGITPRDVNSPEVRDALSLEYKARQPTKRHVASSQ